MEQTLTDNNYKNTLNNLASTWANNDLNKNLSKVKLENAINSIGEEDVIE